MEGVRSKTGAALLWEEVVLTDGRGTATFHFLLWGAFCVLDRSICSLIPSPPPNTTQK